MNHHGTLSPYMDIMAICSCHGFDLTHLMP
jgi:hypothetical protein